jgi:hypothetical protein
MNKVLIAAAVAALAAIFYFGHKPVPAPEKSAPTTVITKPAPQKPKPKPGEKPVVYHRVEQDGTQGPETACVDVKNFAEGKSQAELAAIAKQYGVSVDEVKRWYICIQ